MSVITTDDTGRASLARRPARGRWRWPAALLATATLATGCAPADAPPEPATGDTATAPLTRENVDAWLDETVPAALEDGGIAGGAVSVVHDGELLTAREYGYADVEAEKPVDAEDTLFRVASVSKSFTATAVMQLVEAGELDLDTDVEEYVDFELERTFPADITLRHLLTHTAGYEERIAGAILPEGTEADLRESVSVDPPHQLYVPGTTPAYSNYGYALAGYIVEHTSGTPLDDYFRQNIFEPAGMTSSTLAQPLPEELRSRLSNGYVTADGPPRAFETVSDSPAGAVTSSATDMARFMLAHLGDLDDEGGGLLQPDTRALMQEPGLASDSLGGLAEGSRMTLGFFEEDRNGQRVLGHGGDSTVFHSHMQILPEQDAGIFLNFNSDGKESAVYHLRSTLLEGFADRFFPPPGGGADGDAESPTAQEHARMLEGSYASSRSIQSNFMAAYYAVDGATRITANPDGTIVVNPAPESLGPGLYEEVEPWVWREVGGHRLLAARLAGGEVEAFGGAASTYLPAGPAQTPSVVVPVLGASLLVLVLTMLSWPVGALVRRWRSLPKPGPAGRRVRVLTRVGVAAVVVAAAGWIGVVVVLSQLQDVPTFVLRLLQVLQLLGLGAIVPSAMALTGDIGRKAGWARYAGGALVLLALLGMGWIALFLNFLSPSVSY
ncbi:MULTISPECIES: serine hydrolase domain-containing protein [Nocardiopsis]|uniref:Serine hydrolase n=1 Tax=Nocardiopsis sinuspersici TaxID=501010 RepID=A0A1V3C2I8_9ACTN|nr:serine hydrolase [Nocardiopsis sinuspersici]